MTSTSDVQLDSICLASFVDAWPLAREREVYELLIQDTHVDSEIGQRLFISESTAKVHVRHIYEKLGVHTRWERPRTANIGQKASMNKKRR